MLINWDPHVVQLFVCISNKGVVVDGHGPDGHRVADVVPQGQNMGVETGRTGGSPDFFRNIWISNGENLGFHMIQTDWRSKSETWKWIHETSEAKFTILWILTIKNESVSRKKKRGLQPGDVDLQGGPEGPRPRSFPFGQGSKSDATGT